MLQEILIVPEKQVTDSNLTSRTKSISNFSSMKKIAKNHCVLRRTYKVQYISCKFRFTLTEERVEGIMKVMIF